LQFPYATVLQYIPSNTRTIEKTGTTIGSLGGIASTTIELLFRRIRPSRTEAPGYPPKSQHSPGCQVKKALRNNGSHGSRLNAAAS
jgi:hypothetical protein